MKAKTLIFEDNVISLRTAIALDDGATVSLQLLPEHQSSVPDCDPRKRPQQRPDDCVYLYRHLKMACIFPDVPEFRPLVTRHLKPITSGEAPQLRLVWADEGNSVAVLLNEEPWAFIIGDTHHGYSKGVLVESSWGGLWNQELFEKTFGG